MCMVFANIICLYPTVVYVKVDDDRVKMFTADPAYTLWDMMFKIDLGIDIEKFIVVLEDKIVPIDTNVIVLFNKTSGPLKYLKVLSKISELDDSYK